MSYIKQKCLGKNRFLNTSVIELVNELLVLIASAISESSDETAHSRQSLCCSHKQSRDVDEDSDSV